MKITALAVKRRIATAAIVHHADHSGRLWFVATTHQFSAGYETFHDQGLYLRPRGDA